MVEFELHQMSQDGIGVLVLQDDSKIWNMILRCHLTRMSWRVEFLLTFSLLRTNKQ